jgi:hypothetical protein
MVLQVAFIMFQLMVEKLLNIEQFLHWKLIYIIYQYGCNHNQMNQRWWKTQGLQSFLWSFSLYHRKDFCDEIFCNMLLKIHITFSIHHIFCINFSWITKNFLKVYKFYQILHLVLKNYLNFKFDKKIANHLMLYFIFS